MMPPMYALRALAVEAAHDVSLALAAQLSVAVRDAISNRRRPSPASVLALAAAVDALNAKINGLNLQAGRELSGPRASAAAANTTAVVAAAVPLCGALADAARALQAHGGNIGIAESVGAVAAAAGAALADVLRAPQLEALTRAAGVPLRGQPAGARAAGTVELARGELDLPAGWSPRRVMVVLAGLCTAMPAFAGVCAAPGFAEGVASWVDVPATCGAVAAAAARAASLVVRGTTAGAPGAGAAAGQLDIAALARLVAAAPDPLDALRLLETATFWARPAAIAPLLDPDELAAAALDAGAAARRALDAAAAAGGAEAETFSCLLALLVCLAGASPGAAGALWAAGGGAAALRDAARGLCAALEARGGTGGDKVAHHVQLLVTSLVGETNADARGGQRGGRLVAASGAPRLLARFAARRWRARAAAADVGARGGEELAACAAGLGGDHFLNSLLLECWMAAEPAGALLGAAGNKLDSAWVQESGVLELPNLGAPGEEEELADAYEALAERFAAQEARLEEEFERDEAPALRAAGARAAARFFGCSSLRCAATAGLSCTEAAPLAKLCSRCRVARYCSAECQAGDWRAGHKAACRTLAAERSLAAEREGGGE
jgi:hypothetical protein